MNKTKIKNILVIVFTLTILALSASWVIPLMGQDENADVLIFTDEKAFLRDVMPVVKASGYSVSSMESKSDNVRIPDSKKLILDGQVEADLSAYLESYEGDLIIVDPDEKFKMPQKLSGRTLIIGEAGGALKEDKNAVMLYNSLTDSKIEPNGRQVHADKGNVSLCVTPAPIVMIGSLSSDSLKEIGTFLGFEGFTFGYIISGIRLLLSVIMLFSLLALAYIIASEHAEPLEFPEGIVDAKIKSTPLFFLSRLGLIAVSVLVALVVLLGLGLFDSLRRGGVLFISYVIGASLTTRVFYHFGMLGIKGKPIDIKIPYSSKNLIKTLFFTFFVVACGLALSIAGFWSLDITTSKLIMSLVVFALLTYGFISVMQDLALLQKAADSQKLVVGLLLFPYIPLFLIAAVYVPLGEFYMTMSVLKLIVYTCICLLLSKIIRDRTGSVIYASVSGAAALSFMVCCQNYI